MRLILCLFISILTTSVFASTVIETQIREIDFGLNNEESLLFLTTGQVVSYPNPDSKTVQELREVALNKTWIRITINDKNEFMEFTAIPSKDIPQIQNQKLFSWNNASYEPSILADLDEARSFFYDARHTEPQKETQCFNRAHIWAYEWRTKRNLYSSKSWLFFTRKFIRKYKFEWWFHVAPMVHVIVDGQVKERVMDIKYAKGPLKLKQWTDIFMRDNANCPVVTKYSDHANYPESGSCFLMKSSMHYYQPIDLENAETFGYEKTMWNQLEVKEAYREAFDITL